MSLDVFLTLNGPIVNESEEIGKIYIREGGSTHEISPKEWKERFGDREPVFAYEGERMVFHRNITHNLGPMARRAGIYEALWRPEEFGITKAFQLIEVLTDGLWKLETSPDYFKELNPSNGWGSYERLIEFVTEYLAACKEYPDAEVEVSR